MKSPFPGMDPYLERHYRDVHADLICIARRIINKELPDDLLGRIDERRVTQNARQNCKTERHTESYLTIIDAEGGELITVIELLSPTNKLPGEDREQYRRKRSELLRSRVNVVEIDLIRAGSWLDLLPPYVAPARGYSTYRVMTRRVHPKERAELYPISLRQPLPIIRVPLRASGQDVPLDLQGLIEQVYENGRYDRSRYASPCEPPLEPTDAQWADELLREAGRR